MEWGQLEKVVAADTAAMAEMGALLSLGMPGYWSEGMLRSDVAQQAGHYCLARAVDSGEALGFAGFQLVLDEAHLAMLVVHPECRRRGVGTALLHGLLRWAREVGARRMTLEVRASNAAAISLYCRFGFETLGRRERYYGEEDALVMWTPRIDTPHFTTLLGQVALPWPFA
ncbi:ribosomal protein S18-alanine N-acetyltransferase [Gloeobacter violaceus]|uniref:Glr2063 protein n=1 Tax=Gloeobacter violaceus (strain ATCC 29082 / PCC 7421) TaxID=251221 RepID=Q7NIW9_GLOVI|nr:ribosomal protein S18-alanine N-acetyltransferase [Gloeobacter violaceus]BAC90004.1 glr2063 [Gloeobacter violaceus PCC 7421]